LEDLGHEVLESGDIAASLEPNLSDMLPNFTPFLKTAGALRAKVAEGLVQGRTPVVLGGDHSLAMASVSAAVQHFGDSLAVLWIDAHADLNTPDCSPSGNLHGMPLAALMGERYSGNGEAQWDRLLDFLGPKRLKPDNTAWFGLRDVDTGERRRLKKFPNSLPITMHDVDRYTVVGELERFQRWIGDRKATHLWISFDVDALDPILTPGTGTAVRGGLTYREGHLVAEILSEQLAKDGFQLAGVDLVETNPLCDNNNETAKVAVEWLASLFGKTILGVQ